MSLYRIEEEIPELRAPLLIAAFDAWVDAGGVATGAARHIASGGRKIGAFDSDALMDYRARRPILDVVDGELKELAWHDIEIVHVNADSRDLIVVSGPEPDFRWKELRVAMVELGLRLGVVEMIVLGALPSAVPHTRTVPIMATSTPRDRLPSDEPRPEGLLRVPAAALSVVQMAFIEAGVPVVGFFAQIPHYVSPTYSAGVVALVERLARQAGIDIPIGGLAEEAREQRAQLDQIVASRPDVAEHVQRLEQMAPEPGFMQERIPSADEIAAEVEKFLRRRDS
ncbi:MAG: PAC2 family protein [Actinomycetota bacterium]